MSQAESQATTRPDALALPAITSYQSAHDAIDALSEAVMDYARPMLASNVEGLVLVRAALDLQQVATTLRLKRESLKRGDADAEAEPEGETVTKLYGAWLTERGIAVHAADTGASNHGDAWGLAVVAFRTPARESYEIRHKLEMLEWVFDGSDPGPHVRRAAFAGILADLEG